jgi:hypothetical protein
MANTKQQIANNIAAYMQKSGGAPRAWYVGISKDARARLFNDHNVTQNGGAWIYDQAFSAQDAREVEAYFVNTVGTDGGTGGGDYTADMVYAYKKTAQTNP